MISNPWILVGFGAALIATAVGSFHIGRVYESAGNLDVALTQANKVIEVQKVINVEVPKIITRVVEREVRVTEEVERVIVKSEQLLAPDCVMPADFGMLLVAAANGVDPDSGNVDAFTGDYGCREVLAAVLKDLRAGWRNSARLEGLQAHVALVEQQAKGASP